MITYRPAIAADAPLIHALLSEMAEAEGGSIGGGVAALLRHGFGPEPRFRVLLAQEQAVTLGFCLFLPEYSSWRGAMGVFVQDIYVRPGARGKGLGRGLLAATLAAPAATTPPCGSAATCAPNPMAREMASAFTAKRAAPPAAARADEVFLPAACAVSGAATKVPVASFQIDR